jgi:hypothetical protein
MATKALLVRLEAKPGKEGAVEDFFFRRCRSSSRSPARNHG